MSHHLFYNEHDSINLEVRNISIPYNIQYLIYLIIVQFRQLAAFWLLGLFAGAYISAYGGYAVQRLASKLSDGNNLFLGLLLAAVLGALSPVTMYGMLPVLAVLLQAKLRQSIITSFMITSVLINPNIFIYSFALGVDIALLRLALCILCGVIGGLIVEIVFKGKAMYESTGFSTGDGIAAQATDRRRTLNENFRRAARRMAPNLALGVLLAALFQVYFPQGVFDYMFGKSSGLGVLFAASLGVPAYYCGGGTIPLIKAWLSEGMSSGSAMAFMITGPVTRFTNMTAVKTIMPKRTFMMYMAYNIAFAVMAGIIMDIINGIR